MQILSHFSSKASPSLLLPSLTSALAFRRRPPNFPFYPSPSFKFPSLACHLSSLPNNQPPAPMDSPPPEQPSVDSVTHDLRNQTLAANDAPPRAKLKLEDLNWDNSFVRELPGDTRTDTFPREVLHSCFTKVTPSAQVDDPQLVAWTQSVAESLELDPQEYSCFLRSETSSMHEWNSFLSVMMCKWMGSICDGSADVQCFTVVKVCSFPTSFRKETSQLMQFVIVFT